MARARYPSDLRDAEWKLLKPYVCESEDHTGKQGIDRREIINAVFWIVRTGAQWRYMPHDLPHWRTVYEYFVKWAEDGTWERIERSLRPLPRSASGRPEPATLGIIDSQTAKTTEAGGPRGYDGNKKMLGRKRNLIVDSLGLPIAHSVNPANVHDSQLAPELIREAKRREPDLKVIIGDKAYRGAPLRRVAAQVGGRVEIVETDGHVSRFVPLEHRWKVERTFAWHGRNRRLSKDYERTVESSGVRLFCVLANVSNHRGTPECVSTPGRASSTAQRSRPSVLRGGTSWLRGAPPGVLTHSGVPR